MSRVTWIEPRELFPAAAGRLEPVDVVLDIGCGIRPQNLIRPKIHICCEPFGQYVARLLEMSARDRRYLVVRATWEEAVRIFPARSVDSVFLVDVIEHLEKEDGIGLLEPTAEIARRQVAVFTPLGFLPQSHPDGKDAWGMDGGEWQTHRSGWHPEDFDDAWEVYAARAFHTHDHMQRPFPRPYGAFWAIRTRKAD